MVDMNDGLIMTAITLTSNRPTLVGTRSNLPIYRYCKPVSELRECNSDAAHVTLTLTLTAVNVMDHLYPTLRNAVPLLMGRSGAVNSKIVGRIPMHLFKAKSMTFFKLRVYFVSRLSVTVFIAVLS